MINWSDYGPCNVCDAVPMERCRRGVNKLYHDPCFGRPLRLEVVKGLDRLAIDIAVADNLRVLSNSAIAELVLEHLLADKPAAHPHSALLFEVIARLQR